MKAIILSAGQGRRLLPLTESSPKCILPIQGQSLIEWQIDELLRCGIDQVVAVLGYGAEQVERILDERYRCSSQIKTLFNPFYNKADNLMSCWLAREEMREDFILLNGDTLFDSAVLECLLTSPRHPITLARDFKPMYDVDDMKVKLQGNRLLRIGKHLDTQPIDGESIGMLLFRGEGPSLFRTRIEQAARKPEALQQWYLSVIDQLADSGYVWTQSIHGMEWIEIDYPVDLDRANKLVANWLSRWQDSALRA